MAHNMTNLRRWGAYRLEARVVWVAGSGPATDHGRRASWSVSAWSLSAGVVTGVDVADLLILDIAHAPGGARPPQRALFLDERAEPDQVQALVDCFGGRLAGPLAGSPPAEFGFYQLPIAEYDGVVVVSGRLRLEVPPERSAGTAEMTPLVSGLHLPAVDGWTRALVDVWANIPELGLIWRQRGCPAALGEVVLVS